MSQSADTNRRIVLAKRPSGAPAITDFRVEQTEMPQLVDGQMLLRTLYLSLDPYMRGRMNEGPSYAQSVALDEVMVGATVCRVMESRNDSYRTGDLVLASSGWQDYALSDGQGVMKLDASMPHPSYALGVLGMPGFTAHVGLYEIGEPKAGETVVVAAATGAVGSIVGQLAKLRGCRVVGIAGGHEKCEYAVGELGFDACIDHHQDDMPQQLAAACPDGIDVYFENVGGEVLDAVVPLLNVDARIPVCGLISYYNGRPATDQDHMPTLLFNLLVKRVKMQGFIIFDHYGPKYEQYFKTMTELLQQGRIKYREDVLEGLETAPQGLIGLLQGYNFGKLVVHVAD